MLTKTNENLQIKRWYFNYVYNFRHVNTQQWFKLNLNLINNILYIKIQNLITNAKLLKCALFFKVILYLSLIYTDMETSFII